MATLFELLGGGSPTSILDSTANLAAEKLASNFPVSSEPPADAFEYFNNDFFNQDNSGILGTDQAQNTLSANPILASELNAARNLGVPQDNRFTGILKNTVARPLMFQAGANVGLGAGQLLTGAANPLFALAGAIGSQFLPLDRRPSNLDYQYVNQPGGVNVVDNKITTGVLSGKNFASGFGSNNLGTMYQDYIDTMTGRGMVTDEFGNLVFDEEELTDSQKEKLKDAKAELNAYLTTGPKIRGYRDSVRGRTMTPREFAFNYNQGIGQFAQPDYDKLDTQSYTGSTESGGLGGGEFTDSMGNVDYSDPYDPGGGE